ncbi:glycoside hydrolase family 88 protein, partial [candidate division KSB1 bacterium]|nr:glycoside hydrolase family 88 protein [candidate division KSB1 bacterium]
MMALADGLVQRNLEFASRQLAHMLNALGDPQKHPRSLNPDGSLRLVASTDWTSGFFPGCLWLMYEHTGESRWKSEAQKFTAHLEKEQFNRGTHDLGFMMYCSFGNGYRLTGDEDYKRILLQSARSLMSRFNPNVGCIRSWDHHEEVWQYPVIIDNMMNLELLFWAAKASGDSAFYKIAVTHA